MSLRNILAELNETDFIAMAAEGPAGLISSKNGSWTAKISRDGLSIKLHDETVPAGTVLIGKNGVDHQGVVSAQGIVSLPQLFTSPTPEPIQFRTC